MEKQIKTKEKPGLKEWIPFYGFYEIAKDEMKMNPSILDP